MAIAPQLPTLEGLAAGPISTSIAGLKASLPMYDPPELQATNDALWAAISDRLAARGVADAPQALTRGDALPGVWVEPGLLLSQTCGYPLMTALQGGVQLVATPRYRAFGCDGPFHRGAVVVRTDHFAVNLYNLRGARCAVNDLSSNSGMNLLRAEIAPLAGDDSFFEQVIVTGSHAASAEAVVEGRAHVASLDCVTFAHLQRFRPELTRELRVLLWTSQSPGLPLITSNLTKPHVLEALRLALDDVAKDPALLSVRKELLIEGFNTLPRAYYRSVLHFEHIAEDLGYPVLR